MLPCYYSNPIQSANPIDSKMQRCLFPTAPSSKHGQFLSSSNPCQILVIILVKSLPNLCSIFFQIFVQSFSNICPIQFNWRQDATISLCLFPSACCSKFGQHLSAFSLVIVVYFNWNCIRKLFDWRKFNGFVWWGVFCTGLQSWLGQIFRISFPISVLEKTLAVRIYCNQVYNNMIFLYWFSAKVISNTLQLKCNKTPKINFVTRRLFNV